MSEEDVISDKQLEDAMDDYHKELHKHYEECERVNNRILNAIHKVKGKKFHDAVLKIISEDEVCGKFEIVKTPVGKYQDENWGGGIKGVWVKQWSNGMEGDSFSGFICVKLKENKWLKMEFSM